LTNESTVSDPTKLPSLHITHFYTHKNKKKNYRRQSVRRRATHNPTRAAKFDGTFRPLPALSVRMRMAYFSFNEDFQHLGSPGCGEQCRCGPCSGRDALAEWYVRDEDEQETPASPPPT